MIRRKKKFDEIKKKSRKEDIAKQGVNYLSQKKRKWKHKTLETNHLI